VKITDFGLAKVTDPDDATSTIIGSPNYMPPEQFEGKVQDGRSDIYSLGISFYLMLTGVRPFDGNSPAEILRNIMTKEPEEVETLAQGLPRGLSPIVRRMIERDLGKRYSDVGDVARDLRRLYTRETGGVRVFCAGCGTPNALGVKRCVECSSSLMEPCPKCGTEDFIGVKFCGNCGCSIAQEKEFAEILAEGRDLRTSGRPDRALEKFNRLVELRPDDEEVRVALDFVEKEASALEKHRASVLKAMETGDLDRAGELLEQALERFAGDPDLRAAEEQLADQLRRTRIDACLATAREGLDHRRYEDALAAAEEAAAAGASAEDVDPVREEAQAALDRLAEIAARARDLEAEGSISAAIDEWGKAKAIAPDWAPAVEALEAHRERIEKTEAAKEIATQAFEKGDLAAARASALEVVDTIGDDAQAAEILDRVAKAEGEIRDRVVTAMRQLTSGDTRGAFSEVEDLLDRFPSYPDLGEVRERLEILLESAEYFRRLSSTSEETGRLEQAVAFAGVADWLNAADSRAREAAERTEREIEEHRATVRRVRELLEGGDFAAAVETIRPLAESHPDDGEVQALLVDARHGLEEKQREKQRRLVAELNEALREAREALRGGDLETARSAAGKARKLAPDSAEVKAVLKAIDETTERERKVEETAFFRLEDLRRMAKEGQ
jgi:tetratricopeptide (TPR) repeat protein